MPHTVVTVVSFERTPPGEITGRTLELQALGWAWVDNKPQHWLAQFTKDFDAPLPEPEVQREIRRVLGEFYVDLCEIAAPGSSRRPLDPDQ
jgi:hypothetical protein